jgi:homoserine kinase type II
MREIDEILERFPPDCHPLHIEPLGSAGGMSGAQFWRINAPIPVVRGSPDPAHVRTLLVRRWPAEHPTPQRLRFIHAVLQHAAQRGIPFLPLPIATRSGQSFVAHAGHLWEFTPWLPGAADYEQSPSAAKLHAAL